MPNLVEKLVTAVRECDAVFKEGRADQGFAYMRILDIANALREKLFAAGVLVLPSDVELVVERRESVITDREWVQAQVKTLFTVTDGIESSDYFAYGYAQDLDGFAISIAQTMALKSFLKRLGFIFGERDDPQREDQYGYNLNLEEGAAKWGDDLREWPISRHDAIAFNAAAQASGYTKKGIVTYLDARFGVEKITDLKRKDFKEAMAKATAQDHVEA